jgi:hypothetical protein
MGSSLSWIVRNCCLACKLSRVVLLVMVNSTNSTVDSETLELKLDVTNSLKTEKGISGNGE